MNKIIDIYKEAEKQYSNMLKSFIENDLQSFFPLNNVRFSKPNNRNSREEQIKILDYLVNNSRDQLGFGYKINWNITKNTRAFGEVTLPQNIEFSTFSDYLKFIDKDEDFFKFKEIYQLIEDSLPNLKQWVYENPLELTKYKNDWVDIIKVCKYFLFEHKQDSTLYIRQLPIEIHTKFIENHKKIINSILLSILPKESFNWKISRIKGNNFEKKFYINYDRSLIRLRILDEKLNIDSKISDFSLRPEEFYKFEINCKKVIIVENKMNFLAFPKHNDAIVIWGEANKKLNVLCNASWIKDKQVLYQGDIDTWGLKILANYRCHFPKSKAILMSKEIFEEYQNFAVSEKMSFKECPKELTNSEKDLFNFLLKQPKEKNRLEQEHIPQEELLKILKNV
jgi:hypothetical protein